MPMQAPSTAGTANGTSDSRLRVRTATLADLSAVVRFNLASARDQGEPRLDRIKVEQSVRSTLRQWTTSRSGTAFYLLAERDGQLIGQLRIQPTRFDWYGKEFWQVQHVYVEPAYRHRGVCRSLLQEAQRRATIHGAGNLHLLVAHDNQAARRAYEKGGFKRLKLDLMVIEI